jgi:23S rRNA (cytidine1920-2'-O)/16S rRNA (cytidine1409-2'-O)-methyltransferase
MPGISESMPRLDQLLVSQGSFASREKARRAVMAGIVRVAGQIVDKPGTAVAEGALVEVVGPKEPFVSRGGRKLAAALDHFEVDPAGIICLDVGSSTGGFTDCLLQRGAVRVYAVDVGKGQLDYGLRQDARVVVMEGLNARHLASDTIPELCGLITMDLSFISVVKVVPSVLQFLAVDGQLLVLVKPQFEVGKGQVGKGGIVRDEDQRQNVIRQRCDDLSSLGLELMGIVDSELPGAKGNVEAFALLGWQK